MFQLLGLGNVETNYVVFIISAKWT